jgi:hypothetical protein
MDGALALHIANFATRTDTKPARFTALPIVSLKTRGAHRDVKGL